MRGRSSPPQNAIARAPATTVTRRPATSRSPRSGSRAAKRRWAVSPRESENATRTSAITSNSARRTSSTGTVCGSPRPSPSTPSSSTSWWKRTASRTKTSDNRNAVEPNAATANSARRKRPASVLVTLGKPPEPRAPLWVQPAHMASEVRQREIAEVLHHGRDLRLGPPLEVVLARERRRVDVQPPRAPAHEHALAVQPRHHGQQRRVRARLLAAAVEGLLHVADGRLATRPDLVHDLALQLVQRRWRGVAHAEIVL